MLHAILSAATYPERPEFDFGILTVGALWWVAVLAAVLAVVASLLVGEHAHRRDLKHTLNEPRLPALVAGRRTAEWLPETSSPYLRHARCQTYKEFFAQPFDAAPESVVADYTRLVAENNLCGTPTPRPRSRFAGKVLIGLSPVLVFCMLLVVVGPTAAANSATRTAAEAQFDADRAEWASEVYGVSVGMEDLPASNGFFGEQYRRVIANGEVVQVAETFIGIQPLLIVKDDADTFTELPRLD